MSNDIASIWSSLVEQGDSGRVAAAGFSQRTGFGRRPAVLVIDAQNYMVGPVGEESFPYPSSCGDLGRRALHNLQRLLASARAASAPVFYTRFELARDGSDIGAYGRKRQMLDTEGWCLQDSFGAQVADLVEPEPNDVVLVKKKPSAFVGTPLTGMLIDRQVDTVIVTGGSTSNCVRATAVDAASLNYRVVIPADCVFDRVDVSHRIALYDLDRQYGDVMWSDDVIERLSAVRSSR